LSIYKWIEENKYLFGETEAVSVAKLLEFLKQSSRPGEEPEIKRKDKKNNVSNY